MILKTENICKRIREEIVRVKGDRIPLLSCVSFGEDASSLSYFRSIKRTAEKVGARVKIENIQGTDTKKIVSFLQELCMDADGILLSRPTPESLDKEMLRGAIDPNKDVDCITEVNLGRLISGNIVFLPPTAGAVMKIIRDFDIETVGKRVVILGRSDVVGKPLSLLFLQKGVDATVTVCHSKTEGLISHTRTADIIVAAVGSPRFLTRDMVRPEAVVIDVGINVEGGNLVGDVDFEDVAKVASMITPTPGGVGPVTTHILLLNLAKAAVNVEC